MLILSNFASIMVVKSNIEVVGPNAASKETDGDTFWIWL
jgi:hypothetical protein